MRFISTESLVQVSPTDRRETLINVWIDFNLGLVVSEREGGQEEAGKDETEDSNNLTLQELREKNAELRQVCEELTKELAGALQERINLRAKLLLLT